MSRSPFSVIILVLIVLVIALFFAGQKMRRSHEAVMESALLNGMRNVYDEVKTGSNRQLYPGTIQRLLIDDDNLLTHLPSFLTKSNIYLPQNPVTIGSDKLLLIVQFGGEWFMIDGLGRQTQTSKAPSTNRFLTLNQLKN